MAIDQNLTKMIKRDQNNLPVSQRSPTFAEKTMEKKWITTEQMLEILKSEPDS